MKTLERPLATTKQFHNAVKRILPTASTLYTDSPKGQRTPETDKGKRYVLMTTGHRTEKDLESIEFILWSQGVTANTRQCTHGVRGTCILSKE